MKSKIDILTDMYNDGLIDEETALKQIQQIISAGLFNSPNTSVSIKNLSINDKPINTNTGGAIINKPSLKSKKKRKSSEKECIATPKPITAENIDKYIKTFFDKHPEVIENYLKENLRIDFKKVTTNAGDSRWALALFIKDKPFSQSTLCLNI